MKTVYLSILVAMLLLIVALGTYEAFAASAGGALIQLSTSHVPIPENIHMGLNQQEEEEDKHTANIDGIFKLDNSPYENF